MGRLSSAAITCLLITHYICCKSASLPCFSKSVDLLAKNFTIPLKNVKLQNGILSFNGAELEEDEMSGSYKAVQGRKGRVVQYPEFAKSVDRSVDPCQDFYSFVCNGWIRTHPIPQDQYQYTQTELLKERIDDQLREILSTPCHEPSREEQLMTTFYNKCIENVFSKSKEGFRMLFAKLREVRRLATITDWLLVMRTERLFHELTVSVDEENSTRNVLQIVPSSPMLTSQIYFDPAYSQQFLATREVLFKMLAIIATEDNRSEFISENILEHLRRVESLIRVDQIMAKISEETEFDTGSIAVTVGELQTMMTSIDWIRYISSLLLPQQRHMLVNREVRISHALTVQRMEEFLSNIDDLTLSDYLDWKVIFHFSSFLGERFHRLMEEFTSQVYGLRGRDRTDDCVTLTTNMFHDIAGRRYLEKHFNFSSIAAVKLLVDDIKSAFLEMLSENDWMDYKTKRRAELKLDFNEQNTYYEIVMSAELWMQERAFRRLDKLNTRDKFDVSVSEVNAFYDGSQNLIAIMAGMLQPPFFNASLPRILNYGALGVVTGHEITHGFDDIGASYDELGNRNNWWDDRTYRNFEWKKQCFDVQYGSIVVKDVQVAIDGKRTEGENIADNGGMRAAARAAARLALQPSEQFIIAGLEDFTTLQYFFMHYAFIWCGSTRRATLLNKLATDVHPPDMYRVNVVLSNQPEFGQAFGCKKGTPMYPEQTCTLW